MSTMCPGLSVGASCPDGGRICHPLELQTSLEGVPQTTAFLTGRNLASWSCDSGEGDLAP